MSWRAGAQLLRETWPLIQRYIPDDNFRADFVRGFIELLENCDMDATDLRRMHPEVDKALDDLDIGDG